MNAPLAAAAGDPPCREETHHPDGSDRATHSADGRAAAAGQAPRETLTPIQSLLQAFLLSSLVERAKETAKMKRWTKSVTPEMTAWAISIRDNPTTYPMGATEKKDFPAGTALARVELHTWTIRDGKKVTGKFRGVTLYELVP